MQSLRQRNPHAGEVELEHRPLRLAALEDVGRRHVDVLVLPVRDLGQERETLNNNVRLSGQFRVGLDDGGDPSGRHVSGVTVTGKNEAAEDHQRDENAEGAHHPHRTRIIRTACRGVAPQ